MSIWSKVTIFWLKHLYVSLAFREMIFVLLRDAVDEDVYLSLAHQMYKTGNYKQALEHSNTVYERNSLRTDNLLLLGAVYYQVCSSSIIVA